jgi:hypothetical protein
MESKPSFAMITLQLYAYKAAPARFGAGAGPRNRSNNPERARLEARRAGAEAAAGGTANVNSEVG